MHKIHLNLKKSHLKNYIPNIFLLVPLAYSSSELWVRKMQTPAHSKGNSVMKKGERTDSALFVGIAEKKMNS